MDKRLADLRQKIARRDAESCRYGTSAHGIDDKPDVVADAQARSLIGFSTQTDHCGFVAPRPFVAPENRDIDAIESRFAELGDDALINQCIANAKTSMFSDRARPNLTDA